MSLQYELSEQERVNNDIILSQCKKTRKFTLPSIFISNFVRIFNKHYVAPKYIIAVFYKLTILDNTRYSLEEVMTCVYDNIPNIFILKTH